MGVAPKYPYLCVSATATEQNQSQNRNSPVSSAAGSGAGNGSPTDPARADTLLHLAKLIRICHRLALAPNVDALLHLAKLEAENAALRDRAVELALEIQGLRKADPLWDRA
jgi:hypothetical protein